MGKTRNLFKKIRATKGTFHAKNGHNKGQKKYEILFRRVRIDYVKPKNKNKQ